MNKKPEFNASCFVKAECEADTITLYGINIEVDYGVTEHYEYCALENVEKDLTNAFEECYWAELYFHENKPYFNGKRWVSDSKIYIGSLLFRSEAPDIEHSLFNLIEEEYV